MPAREQVILKINNEWNEFIEDLKTKTASEVIEKAFEIYTKEMFKNVLENCKFNNSNNVYENLLWQQFILDALY